MTIDQEKREPKPTRLSNAQRAHLEKRLQKFQALPAQVIQPRPHEEKMPLSFAQQRLWFLDQLEAGKPIYNITAASRVTGTLNYQALEQSITAILSRHEVLRATFDVVADEPVQKIQPLADFRFMAAAYTGEVQPNRPDNLLIDLRHLPAEERETAAHCLTTLEMHRPFNLSTGPLLRASLFRLGVAEHILILTMHHIVSDGWSMGIFFRELGVFYDDFVNGRSPTLSPLPIQYSDFAHWQQKQLSGDRLEKQLRYWRQQLDGAATLLELPTDQPRPAIQRFQGAAQTHWLPTSLSQMLHSLTRQEGITPFMILLTAFATLLHRYTRQDDILIGSPIANRIEAQTEALIGFFVNTLVLRTDLSDQPTFRQLLQRVRETTLEAYAHQELPFEKLVEELRPERNLSHTPLFQVLFSLQNTPSESLKLSDLTFQPVKLDSQTTQFDLALHLEERNGRFLADISYNTDLFEAATITRMLNHYGLLLQNALADPDTPLSDLTLLTEPEQQQLQDWNNTSRPSAATPVHHLFEAQAVNTPHQTAVYDQQHSLTYSQLNQRANQLAHHLRRLGVQPDTCIGICLERSLDMLTAVLAVLKAGGAYVPLDPMYPAERLAFMIEDAQIPILLTQQDLLAHPQGITIHLDTAWPIIAHESTANLEPTATINNLAYVIYTSGSTGQPKGVAMPHRSLSNLLAWQRRLLPDPAKTVQFTSLSFDVSFQEIFSTWQTGGTLRLLDEKLRRDMPSLLRLIKDEAIERLFMPFVALQQFADIAVTHEVFPRTLTNVMTAGEQLQITPAISQLFRQLPSCRLHNQYGPTESHVVVTNYTMPDSVDEWPALPPIGRPADNTQIHLLDPHGNLVPVSIPGELHIGGNCLARGYVQQPELTASRFIIHPTFGTLYKTGDLARYLPDGNIAFLGRIDQQVKIRGYRIEPGEIETVLGQHEAVREAIVITRAQTSAGSKQLLAYIIPQDQQTASNAQLRLFLKSRLPEFMIPSHFIRLDTWPLTLSGKINRRALPAPDELRPAVATPFALPRTPIETALVTIWADLLTLSSNHVGIHNSFFELGGHSLLATQLISRLRTVFQVSLPLRDLFEAPTIAELSARVEAARRAGDTWAMPPIQSVSRNQPLPLSFAQQRLWFLDQLDPGTPAYNLPEALHLTGQLDISALEHTLTTLAQRHESLRTIFPLVDNQPVQVIQPAANCSFTPADAARYAQVLNPLIDLTLLPPARRLPKATEIVNELANYSFDLAQGPLWHVAVLQLAQNEFILIIVMHHIIADGWSKDIFRQELAALYAAFHTGNEAPALPELAIQYADFASWQNEWLREEGLAEQLAYWRQQLAGSLPLLALPNDHPRPSQPTFQGGHVSQALPAELAQGLKTLIQRQGTTLFMLLLAAFKVLLYRYTRQTDILVGSPIANRRHTAVEGLIGFFVNTLVLRSNLAGNPAFDDFLLQVRNTALDAYDHQDLPFEQLVEALQPDRNLSQTPLFQVMFLLVNAPETSLSLPNLTLKQFPFNGGPTKFDLTLAAIQTEAGLAVSFEYNRDLFEADTIERMSRHFLNLLADIVSDPTQRLADLNLLNAAEQKQLVILSPDPVVEDTPLIATLFEAQAAATPDATALTCAGATLTYQQLNERANKLAHYLQSQGVKAGMVVGIGLERSPELVVALLAMLKVGGTILPLDPAYPAERLAFMLTDAQAAFLLTTPGLIDRESIPIVILSIHQPILVDVPVQNPTTRLSQNAPAYLIYTSGSTGTPKGVLVSHEALARHCLTVKAHYALCPTDRVLQFASFSFDASLEQLFPALICGAAVLLRDETLWSAAELRQQIIEAGLTVVNLPTAYWRQVCAEWSRLVQWPAETALRLMIVGGEVMIPADLQRWQEAGLTDVTLLNAYGPTEATITATTYTVRPETAVERIPIGQPLPGRTAVVLDEHGNLTPIGVPGELHLGGVCLALGYHNRPELTAAKFVPDPFHPASALLYKTGDLARVLPSGEIEFLGRVDDQVKVRGFRIELGEIEHTLSQHPDIKAAVVTIQEHEGSSRYLVAYIEASQEHTADQWRQYLKTKLPDYMIPQTFVSLGSLPLTPAGKIDRQALPAPELQRVSRSLTKPRTALEEVLTILWGDVLHQPEVGIHDNFFELGGHSLMATLLVGRIRDFFQIDLPLRRLFESPTVADLAAVMLTTSNSNRLEQTAQLLLSVINLSEEETESLLATVHPDE